jgi:hypothetical protein
MVSTVFFEYFKDYPVCGRDAAIQEKALPFCPRKTVWSRITCARACNNYIGLYWAILKCRESDYPGFQLSLNRISSHSVECHFGMTRSTLNGFLQWDRFFSAQVKAVMSHKVMRRIDLRPYIRRFVMPAGCIVLPEDGELLSVDFGGICKIIDCIKGISWNLAANHSIAAYEEAEPLFHIFLALNGELNSKGFTESVPESDPLSGGGIKNRLFSGH